MEKELQKKLDELPSVPLTGRMKDLTNKKKKKITFIKPAEKINNRMHWWVVCDCGEILKVRSDSPIKSCKNCQYEQQSKERKGVLKKDLTGQRFGKITALYPTNQYQNTHILWHCKCDCGREIDVEGASLLSGNTKSCGCIKKETLNFKAPFLVIHIILLFIFHHLFQYMCIRRSSRSYPTHLPQG